MVGTIIAILVAAFIGTLIFGAIFTYNDKKLDEKSGKAIFLIVFILIFAVLLVTYLIKNN